MVGNPRAGLQKASSIFKIVDYEKRIIKGTMTTERLDRDNEIVDHLSVKSAFPYFLEVSPALVILHDLLAPAGRVLDYRIGEKNGSKAIDITVQVAKSRNPDTPCEFAWEMVEQGVFNGFSFQYEYEKKVSEKTAKGMAKRVFISDIWEVSLVPVMANPDGTFKEVIKSLKSLLGTSRGKRKKLMENAIKSLTIGEKQLFDEEAKKEINEMITTAVKAQGETFSQELKSLGENITTALTDLKTPTPPAGGTPPKGAPPTEPSQTEEEKAKIFLESEPGKKMLAGFIENSEILKTYKKALGGDIPPGGEEGGEEGDKNPKKSDIKMIVPIAGEGNGWKDFKEKSFDLEE